MSPYGFQAVLLLRVIVGRLLLQVVTFLLRRPRVLLVEQQAPLEF
ncbi:MAG: hypothetical protein NVSMB27_49310 [Ktedonobacteraceae bacterium]